jgi:outer membrane lipoprotein SlyB
LKVRKVLSIVSVALLSILTLQGCLTDTGMRGAGVGAGVGGIAGALVDRHNPYRGALIGAALGAFAGGAISEIAAQTARQAAIQNRPVEYRDEQNRPIIQAIPAGYNYNPQQGRCRVVKIIHNKVIEDGQVVLDKEQEVCVP